MSGPTQRGRVVGRTALSPRVTELTLELEGDEPFRWFAGQHVILRSDVPGSDASYFSIAAAPDPAGPRRMTLAMGNDSDTLGAARLGSLLSIEGPFGKLVWHDAPGALLVCAGTGIAPLRAMVHAALRAPAPTPIVLVAGNRTPGDLLWHEELAALADRHPGFAYVAVVSQPDADFTGRRGYVQEHLVELAGTLPSGFRAYLCGSKRMVEACRALLGNMGVPPERILSEAYA